ncbi:MAG TPA: RNA polymerase sigma factor [Planctomycetota bacterium]|nr:RNA polymerase sigma factor [Planctomycetota bacterium]
MDTGPTAAQPRSHAFASALLQHVDAAYRVALWEMGNAADAEDVVQTVFLEVLARPAPQIHDLKGWFMGAVMHRCQNFKRGELRRRVRETTALQDSARSSMEDAAAKDELIEQTVAAAKSLPSLYRRPVLLHYLEGLPIHEVASILATPEKTVRSQISRGLTQIRESLAGAGVTMSATAIPVHLSSSPLPSAAPEFVAMLKAKSAALPAQTAATAATAWLWPGLKYFGAASIAIVLAVALGGKGELQEPRAEAEAPAPAPLPEPEQKAALDRFATPISLELKPMHAQRVFRRLAQFLKQPQINIITTGYGGEDEPYLHLSGKNRPLKEVLDDLAAQYRGKWYYVEARRTIIFDRTMPKDRLEALLKSVRTFDGDAAKSARELVRAGDMNARRELVLLLAEENPGRARAVINGLRDGLSLNFLYSLTDLWFDAEMQKAFAAHWKRTPPADLSLIECYLAAVMGIADAIPTLRTILTDPDAAMPRLKDNPAYLLRKQHFQAAAGLSLALLGDKECYDGLVKLWNEGQELVKLPLMTAFGYLKDDRALKLIEPHWPGSAQGYRLEEVVYFSAWLHGPDVPTKVLQACADLHGKAAPAEIYLWRWMQYPTLESLPLVLDGVEHFAVDNNTQWRLRYLYSNLLQGCAFLPDDKVAALARERLKSAKNDLAIFALQLILAQTGDADAWKSVCEAYKAKPEYGRALAMGSVLRSGGREAWLSPIFDAAKAAPAPTVEDLQLLSMVDDSDVNKWLVSIFGAQNDTAKQALCQGLMLSYDPQVLAWQKERLSSKNPKEVYAGLGVSIASLDAAMAAARATADKDVRANLLGHLMVFPSQFENVLSELDRSDDDAVLANLVGRYFSAYKYVERYGPELPARQAKFLLKCARRNDPKVRVAAFKSILRWSHDWAPYKVEFLEAIQAARNDDNQEVQSAALNALNNYVMWSHGLEQSFNNWLVHIHGQNDDLDVVARIYKMLNTPAEVPAAKTGDF